MDRKARRGGRSRGGDQTADRAVARRAREPLLPDSHRPENPRVFYFYEQYVDEDGYKAHGDSAHFKEIGFGDAIPRLEERHREFYRTM